jgi:hypothetical protein
LPESQRQTSSSTLPPVLSKEICTGLWEGLLVRLNEGAILVNNEQFSVVIEEEYTKLTGRDITPDIRQRIRRMVVEVNNKHPDTYLILGVQNGIKKAFSEGVKRLNWDMAQIQAKGRSSLYRFSHQESVRELLEEFQLHPDQLDLFDCVVDMVREIDGKRAERPTTAGRAKLYSTPSPSPNSQPSISSPATTSPPASVAATTDSDTAAIQREAIASGEVDPVEAERRIAQQQKQRGQLSAREEKRVPEHLLSYVERGVITADEADKVSALRKVDERLQKGDIDKVEADRIRNSILDGSAREELERKVREAVDHAVIYLQVYQSMQRIGDQYDAALRFLIINRDLVTAECFSSPAVLDPLKSLMDDGPLLESLIDIMERKDQEIRMISVRLPPYNSIASRGLEKIGNMMIGEEFLRDLRQLDEEEISQRLNSMDKAVRVRPAAEMRCLISLVDHLTKRTPFRKEMRMLRVNHTLEDFFRNTSDLDQARHQAESFLNRRLRRLFPDLSVDESNEIKMRGAEMIDTIEQRILSERQQAVDQRRQQVEEKTKESKPKATGGGDEEELSEDERKRGVQIARVEMRVGGSMRRIPLKIMPDEEDEAGRFFIAQRDPETQEIVPQMKRGQKRFIEKGKDGIWKESKG